MGKTCTGKRMNWRVWGLAIASAVLPDADVVFSGFGVNHEDMLGHRGLTHSLPFALAWGSLVVWCEFKPVVRSPALVGSAHLLEAAGTQSTAQS